MVRRERSDDHDAVRDRTRGGVRTSPRLLAGEPVEGAFRYAAPFDRL
jgi:hypothetical protein